MSSEPTAAHSSESPASLTCLQSDRQFRFKRGIVYTGLEKFPALIPTTRSIEAPLDRACKNPDCGHRCTQIFGLGMPPTFRLSWRCPQKQGWQHLQFFPWSTHTPWTILSLGRIKPMRIGIPKMSGLGATTNFRANGGAGKRAGKACGKKMAYRRFHPKPCEVRICVRGMVRGKKKGL
jgi:hypothetical protein